MEGLKSIQLYVNVDGAGNILDVQMGENIIPTDEFSYFFKINEETANKLSKYKVTVHNMQPELVLKEEGGAVNE